MLTSSNISIGKFFKRLVHLGAASTLNTILGLAIISLLYKATNSPFAAIGISATIGYLYSIYSYNAIGFGRGLSRPPYKKYMIVYVSAFAINVSLTKVGLRLTDSFFLVQAFVLPTVVCMQWIASYFWAFRIQD